VICLSRDLFVAAWKKKKKKKKRKEDAGNFELEKKVSGYKASVLGIS
jgi:cation transport regulator ChaB